MSAAALDALFRPACIAVVGASNDVTKIGGIPIEYLRRYGYAGRIVPVNPRETTVQGLPAFPTLQAAAQPIDLAVIAVPAKAVTAAIDDAARAGVRAIVLFSSGFAEVDDAGREAQQALAAQVRAAGIRMIGPNCLGAMAFAEKAYATFSPVVQRQEPRVGNIAIVSQSGAFGAYALHLARNRGLGLSYWVTTGNEADLQAADCIAWLAGDERTKVILCYLEGCRDGDRLKHALALARDQGKMVVVTKVGRTALGSAAAASHTAALAGEDAVYDALFRQYGAWRAQTVEEFFSVGYAASVGRLPRGNRIGLLTVSGGVGALMADDATEAGLQVPELAPERQARLREWVPFAGTRNPVDVTGQIMSDPTLMARSVDLMMDGDAYDMLPLFVSAAGISRVGQAATDAIVDAAARYPQRTLAVIGAVQDAHREKLEAAGCLCFEDPTRAIRAMAALAFFARTRHGAAGTSGLPGGPATSTAVAAASSAAGLGGPGRFVGLNEADALAVLRRAGVPVIDARLARDEVSAMTVAQAIGFPVVVKIVSPDIPHKTEAGGVVLNLATPAAVRDAFRTVTDNAARHRPGARIDGVLVAPMLAGGVETILGVHRDPVFGPVVLCGLGGVFAEVLKDTALAIAPVDADGARRMVDSLRGRAMLDGVRGAPPADVDALVAAIVALSRFAVEHADAIDAVDVNPFVVRPHGQGAVALDALIVPAATVVDPQ